MEVVEGKKSFVLYYSMIRQVDLLDDHQAANLLRAILSTGGVCERPELDPLTEMAFIPIERELEENASSWKAKADKAEAGRAGGKAKAENDRLRKEVAELKEQLANLAGSSNILAETSKNSASLADSSNASSTPSSLAVDVDVAVDVDGDVAVDNIYNAQNERQTTAESGDSTLCSSGDERESVPSDTKKSSKKQIEREAEAMFERLWSRYPRKKGKGNVSKSQKVKLYKLGEQDVSLALDRFIAEMSDQEPQYIPYGSSWFNSGYVDYLGDDYTPPPETRVKPKPSPRSQMTRYRPPEEEKSRAEWLRSREE